MCSFGVIASECYTHLKRYRLQSNHAGALQVPQKPRPGVEKLLIHPAAPGRIVWYA